MVISVCDMSFRKYDRYYFDEKRWILKAPYCSKIDILLSKKGLIKLMYDINTIIKCGTWQPVKFQLVSGSWNEMIFFFIISLN